MGLGAEGVATADGQGREQELADDGAEGDVAVMNVKRGLGLIDAAATYLGKTNLMPTATTRPTAAGTMSRRGCPRFGEDPRRRTCSHSIAMRNDTTRRPEMTPMKMESRRNRRSSRAGAISRSCHRINGFLTVYSNSLSIRISAGECLGVAPLYEA